MTVFFLVSVFGFVVCDPVSSLSYFLTGVESDVVFFECHPCSEVFRVVEWVYFVDIFELVVEYAVDFVFNILFCSVAVIDCDF